MIEETDTSKATTIHIGVIIFMVFSKFYAERNQRNNDRGIEMHVLRPLSVGKSMAK